MGLSHMLLCYLWSLVSLQCNDLRNVDLHGGAFLFLSRCDLLRVCAALPVCHTAGLHDPRSPGTVHAYSTCYYDEDDAEYSNDCFIHRSTCRSLKVQRTIAPRTMTVQFATLMLCPSGTPFFRYLNTHTFTNKRGKLLEYVSNDPHIY